MTSEMMWLVLRVNFIGTLTDDLFVNAIMTKEQSLLDLMFIFLCVRVWIVL